MQQEGADAHDLNPEDDDVDEVEDDADDEEAHHLGAADVDDETPLMSRSAIVRTTCEERAAAVVVDRSMRQTEMLS